MLQHKKFVKKTKKNKIVQVIISSVALHSSARTWLSFSYCGASVGEQGALPP